LKPVKKTKRVHLASDCGGRSRCRYTSRPGTYAKFVPLAEFMALPVEIRCVECSRKAVAISTPAADTGFRGGYFCAVAALLRQEDGATGAVRSLLRQGGTPEGIEVYALALIREHGLM
jgi:hypothetical protein